MKYFVKSVYGRKMRDCDWARSYSAPASPFGRCLGVFILFSFPALALALAFVFGRKTFSSTAACHATPSPRQLTHVADARRAKLARHKDAAGKGGSIVVAFVSGKTCYYAGVAEPALAAREWGQGTRIITDQISDISRGMNVLWCVFYFISLSYNPPANGARFSFALPRGRSWVGVAMLYLPSRPRLPLSLTLLVRVLLGTHGCRNERRRLSWGSGRVGVREMSNAKLRKHGSKIG